MRLIENWHKKIHKLWSARLALLGGALGVANDMLPQLQDYLPSKWYVFLFFLILIARLIKQSDGDNG